ncbi:MAG: hypothetical protein CW346_19790 [Bacillaceae bacterium]|nr:hypothetical protein [Bacillaceae bacterium]
MNYLTQPVMPVRTDEGKGVIPLLEQIIDICKPVVNQQRNFTADEADRILRLAVKLYHRAEREPVRRYAIQLLRDLSVLDGVDSEFWVGVYFGVMHDWIRTTSQLARARRSEYALQSYLVRHWDGFFGESLRLVEREFRIGTRRVDFLAEDDSGPVLIECKAGPIDSQALRQLQTYLHDYGQGRGILVGSELQVELPPGISFIPHRWIFLSDN